MFSVPFHWLLHGISHAMNCIVSQQENAVSKNSSISLLFRQVALSLVLLSAGRLYFEVGLPKQAKFEGSGHKFIPSFFS